MQQKMTSTMLPGFLHGGTGETTCMSIYLVVVVRALAAFILLLAITRALGKKQVAQLTFFEYVFGIGAGTIAGGLAEAIERPPGIATLALLTWGVAALVIQMVTMKSRTASKVVTGEPTVVIKNGQIQDETMTRLRYRFNELLSQLRQKDVFNVADVEFAILEPNGVLSVLKKSQVQNVTPSDLNLQTSYKGIPTEVVVDGNVIESNLQMVNLTKEWLIGELEKQNVRDVRDVAYASLDTSGSLYVDLKDGSHPGIKP